MRNDFGGRLDWFLVRLELRICLRSVTTPCWECRAAPASRVPHNDGSCRTFHGFNVVHRGQGEVLTAVNTPISAYALSLTIWKSLGLCPVFLSRFTDLQGHTQQNPTRHSIAQLIGWFKLFPIRLRPRLVRPRCRNI